MTSLKCNINTIVLGIDRIDIDITINSKARLLAYLDAYNESNTKPYYWKKYCVINYVLKDHRVKVLFKTQGTDIYTRIYLKLYDPDEEFQAFIRDLLIYDVGISFAGRDGANITQVEVSYDMYPVTTQGLDKIESFFYQHLVHKHSKFDSFNNYKGTLYNGKGGNIRKGTKGSRCYKKVENNKHFYRFEMQYNKRYLSDNKYNLLSLPLQPLAFDSLKYIDFYDNICDRNINNIVRGSFRRKDTKSWKSKHRKPVVRSYVESKILGNTTKPTKRVFAQMHEVKKLMDNFGLKTPSKRYFDKLFFEKQLISCLADLSQQDDNSSKRIIYFCCEAT